MSDDSLFYYVDMFIYYFVLFCFIFLKDGGRWCHSSVIISTLTSLYFCVLFCLALNIEVSSYHMYLSLRCVPLPDPSSFPCWWRVGNQRHSCRSSLPFWRAFITESSMGCILLTSITTRMKYGFTDPISILVSFFINWNNSLFQYRHKASNMAAKIKLSTTTMKQ